VNLEPGGEWKVAEIWRWLIQASVADIDALPDMKPGEYLSAYKLPRPQRLLMGRLIHKGAGGCNRYYGWAAEKKELPARKRLIRANVGKVRHWQVTNLAYQEIPNQPATWFVDPPYQHGGKKTYRHFKIDYAELAAWCRSRQGQVIVCENSQADWLPFKLLSRWRHSNGSGMIRILEEMVWIQNQ
jgi:hypothetical protein